ncbi:MAG: cytochrome c oxidase subunit 3 [Vicinamibacterales bacterium]
MSAIPYTVDRRPDTGVNNVQLGMWLFLASEAMLFAGLFSAYFMLRAGAAEPWLPLRGHLASAGTSTFVLFAGTAGFVAAVRAARAKRELPLWGGVMAFRVMLFASSLFALSFCALKLSDYASLSEAGLGPATSTRMAVYFLLTGVHLVHVAGGLLVNLALLLTSPGTWRDAPLLVVNRLEALALYWYFVDAVWLIVFVLLYVV